MSHVSYSMLRVYCSLCTITVVTRNKLGESIGDLHNGQLFRPNRTRMSCLSQPLPRTGTGTSNDALRTTPNHPLLPRHC